VTAHSGVNSPISSRNNVPPSATSTLPRAPPRTGEAPFRWPNKALVN